MNPLVGIAAWVLPDIIRLVAGDTTGQVADKVARLVAGTLGTSDPTQAKAKLDADPEAQEALQLKLTELAIDATKVQNAEADRQRQDQLDRLRLRGDNSRRAGATLEDLAAMRSGIAWTTPVVSYLVIAGFFAFLVVLVWLYAFGPKVDANNFIITILNISVGALTAAFATVVNFWLGSSAGEHRKDAAAVNLQRAQAESTNRVLDTLSQKVSAAPPPPPPAPPPPEATRSPETTRPPKTNGRAGEDGAQKFDACVPYIFRMEGGYSDDPGDPGGATNYGITLATLRAWDRDPDLTPANVRAMTQRQAREIYRANYWNAMQCGALPPGLDLEVFDFGVNAGPSRAIKTLQSLVGVTEDGFMGPVTLAAVRTREPFELIERYTEARLEFYKSLRSESEFLRGWERRVTEIQTAALRMAAVPQTMVA